MQRFVWLGLMLSVAAVFGGCTGASGASDVRLRNDLKIMGLAYHGYHDDNQQGPAGWDELIKYAEEKNNSPDAIRRVKDAGYEVTWGVKFTEVKDGMANTVLAKPPGAGPTLMMDGGVH